MTKRKGLAESFNPYVEEALGLNHPDVFKTGRILAAQIFSNKPKLTGVLEIEAIFGSLANDRFVQHIDENDAQRLLTALDNGKVQWTKKDEDWVLVHDSYVLDNTTLVRVRTIDGKPDPAIYKVPLVRCDLKAGKRDVRVAAKQEISIEQDYSHRISLNSVESVRISTRRRFRVASTVMNCFWQIEISKAWVGKTAQEAEALMSDDTFATYGIEIETTVEWAIDNMPSKEQILLLCIGLLLKIQDIVGVFGENKTLEIMRVTRPVAPKKTRKKKLNICI